MIKNLKNQIATHQCPNCNNVKDIDLSKFESEFLDEFQEYQNLSIKCECGTVEIFNMNIPPNESLGIESIDKQRKHIKNIMKFARKDLRNST